MNLFWWNVGISSYSFVKQKCYHIYHSFDSISKVHGELIFNIVKYFKKFKWCRLLLAVLSFVASLLSLSLEFILVILADIAIILWNCVNQKLLKTCYFIVIQLYQTSTQDFKFFPLLNKFITLYTFQASASRVMLDSKLIKIFSKSIRLALQTISCIIKT